MKAGETNVLRLLQGSKVFVIPSFQRRYSWRAREWEILWADLLRESEVDHSKDSQELSGHFLGSIVLHPASGPASTLMRHLVIDGQQRLTTLIVVLAAIRDVRTEIEASWDPSSYDSQYLTNPYDQENPDRLYPTKLDRDAYVQTVRYGTPTEGIGQAYVWFTKKIREAARTNSLDLERLGRTLLLHMLLVEINTKQGDSVNNIFNTLNSKGMPLAPSDLVRNEILLHVGERDSEPAYERFWLPMESALVKVTPSKIDDKAFVTFLWSREVVRDPSVTRQELFSAFESRLRSALSGLNSAERREHAMQIFEEMYEDHLLFLILDDPLVNPERDARIGMRLREAISLLGSWGSDPTKPFALWIIKHAATGEITEDDAVAAVDILLSFLVRRALAGIPTNLLNRLLTPIPHELESALGKTSVADALAGKLSSRGYYWLRDSEVLNAVVGQPIYVSAKRHVKFLLERVEELLPGMERADTRGSQVEHVIPQTLSDEWKWLFRESDVELDEALSVIHTLGNLTLTDNNQSMGNAIFDEKREFYYGQSALRLNRELSSRSRFLPDDVRSRTVEMARILLDRFPGPSGSATPNIESESAGSSLGDRLESALQSMPEGGWTTVEELVSFLGATHDKVQLSVTQLSPVLVRLVRTESGEVPGWLPADLAAEVLTQSARFVSPSGRLTTEDLSALLARSESVDGSDLDNGDSDSGAA